METISIRSGSTRQKIPFSAGRVSSFETANDVFAIILRRVSAGRTIFSFDWIVGIFGNSSSEMPMMAYFVSPHSIRIFASSSRAKRIGLSGRSRTISPSRRAGTVITPSLFTFPDTVVEIDGNRLTTIAIFGDPGSEALLGAVTLEQFSLAPDPVSKRLVPVEALLM